MDLWNAFVLNHDIAIDICQATYHNCDSRLTVTPLDSSAGILG
jgi:hypothetical protein